MGRSLRPFLLVGGAKRQQRVVTPAPILPAAGGNSKAFAPRRARVFAAPDPRHERRPTRVPHSN
jgi:hypothetical protein